MQTFFLILTIILIIYEIIIFSNIKKYIESINNLKLFKIRAIKNFTEIPYNEFILLCFLIHALWFIIGISVYSFNNAFVTIYLVYVLFLSFENLNKNYKIKILDSFISVLYFVFIIINVLFLKIDMSHIFKMLF